MLWRQAASLMMQQGDLGEAVKSLEELRKSSPDDITTLAQLIVAYSKVQNYITLSYITLFVWPV